MWENLDKTNPDSAHYSVMRMQPGIEGMAALRGMFPDAKANELNFVLFSTSGVHGTYITIEDAERFLKGEDAEGCGEVTFLIVHPRLVALRYGVCDPANQGDIDYLKQLRASSYEVAAGIGTLQGVSELSDGLGSLSEHKFIDNGMGDYNLMCGHTNVGFVPYLVARHQMIKCPECGRGANFTEPNADSDGAAQP